MEKIKLLLMGRQIRSVQRTGSAGDSRPGFTLVEVMVSVVIVAILVTMSTTAYACRSRKTKLYSACANAKVIAAAEKAYLLTEGSYIAAPDTASVNGLLGLNIHEDYFHTYRVGLTGGTPASFLIQVNCASGASSTVYTFNSEGDRISCVGLDCMN